MVESNAWCCLRVFQARSAGWSRLWSTPTAVPARSAPWLRV